MIRLSATVSPGEVRGLTFNFTDSLATGDTLTGTPTITARTLAGTHVLVLTGATVDTTAGTVLTTATIPLDHAAGARWEVTCIMETSGGETLSVGLELVGAR